MLLKKAFGLACLIDSYVIRELHTWDLFGKGKSREKVVAILASLLWRSSTRLVTYYTSLDSSRLYEL